MPVIGSLHGQVDEVIISPIEKRRRGEEPPAEPKNEGPPERSASAQPQTPHANESSRDADELPVWLL